VKVFATATVLAGAMALALSAPAIAGGSGGGYGGNPDPSPSPPTVGVTGNSQSNGGNTETFDGKQKAAINAMAFASAMGVVGANDASGNSNQQANTLYVTTTAPNWLFAHNSQHNGDNEVTASGRNHSQIGSDAFTMASGDIGANVAAGNDNQQSNTLYVDGSKGGSDPASNGTNPFAGSSQGNGQNSVVFSGHNKANIGGDAFENASGVIGANVASGNANQQSNVAIVLSGATLNDTAAGARQGNGGNCYFADGHNRSSIGGNAFSAATGAIGANVSSGNGNQQANVVIVNNPTTTP
jgi:hypothetical protein